MRFNELDSAIVRSLREHGRELPTSSLREARKARLFQYIEDPGKSFAIISASRGEYSLEENVERTRQLKADVRALKLGYVELVGGYVETDKNGNKIEVTEPSLLIPGISKDKAIELGEKFEQESILFKEGSEMSYIATTGEDKGEVQASFKAGAGKDNFTLNDVFNPYFSRFKKGSHRNDNISFVLAEAVYGGEIFRQSLAGGFCPPIWKSVRLDAPAFKNEKLREAKVYRIVDQISNPDAVFAIVSSYRKNLAGEDGKLLTGDELRAANKKRHEALKDEVFTKYGSFIELRGAYKEEGSSDLDVFEQSLFIPQIPRNEAVELGKKFDQDSVIWHGDGKFELIGCDSGEVWQKFKIAAPNISELSAKEAEEQLKKAAEENRINASELVGSWLKKGSQRGKKLVLQEKIQPSFGRAKVTESQGPDCDKIWKDVLNLDEAASRSASRFNSLFNSDNQAFGIVSAERTFIGNDNYVEILSKAENKKRSNRLAAYLREFRRDALNSGYRLSFIPVFGGYNDLQAKTTAEDLGSLERSYIVAIGTDDPEKKTSMESFFLDRMLDIGARFDQESVLIKDSNGLRYIGTLKNSMNAEKDGEIYQRTANFGEVLDHFFDKGFNISGKDAFEYFTRLKNKDISFIWTPAESTSIGVVESFLRRGELVRKELIYPKCLKERARSNSYGKFERYGVEFEELDVDDYYVNCKADVEFEYVPEQRQTWTDPGFPAEVNPLRVLKVYDLAFVDEDDVITHPEFDELSKELQKKLEAAIEKDLNGRDLIAEFESGRDDF